MSKKEVKVYAKEMDKVVVQIWSQNMTTNHVCDDEKAEFICLAVLLE
jgi:hypothetical protein